MIDLGRLVDAECRAARSSMRRFGNRTRQRGIARVIDADAASARDCIAWCSMSLDFAERQVLLEDVS